jgi:hypothetical protein
MSEKLTITMDGYDASQVQAWLDERVGSSVARALDEKVADAIEARVAKLVDELTRERLKKEVDALLDEGWKETDRWGNETGKAFSLRDRVRGALDAKDRYDGNPVDKLVKEAVSYKLEGILKEEMASARTRLKAAFDEVLQAKFSDTIREALGLKK